MHACMRAYNGQFFAGKTPGGGAEVAEEAGQHPVNKTREHQLPSRFVKELQAAR